MSRNYSLAMPGRRFTMVNMLPSRFPTVMRTLLVVPLIAVALTACGAAQEAVSEQLVEQAVGEGVDVEFGDDGQVASIETEDGSFEMSTGGGEVPEEWPDDVPLFDGGEILSSQVVTDAGQTIVVVSYNTDADPEATFDSLIEAYEAAGFAAMSTSNTGDDNGIFATYAGSRGETTVSAGVTSSVDSPTFVQLSISFPAG